MESEAVTVTQPNQTSEIRPSGWPLSSAIRRRVVLLSLLSAAAGIGVTSWFEHARYEHFSGYLQARSRTVVSVREAQVSEILVAPGTLVMAGQPLVRLKDTAFQERLETKRREVKSLEIQLSQSQARLEVELELRRREILERIFEAKLKAAQASRKPGQTLAGSPATHKGGWEKSAQTELSWRAKPPAPKRTAVAQASAAVAAAGPAARDGSSVQTPQSEFELCVQHIAELERMNRELPEKIRRMMGVALAQANLEHAQAELAWLESQKRELTLVAEASGMVGVFHKEIGDHVAAYETIVQLLDEEQPYLVMQIPSSRVSDFAPGTHVNLKFPAKTAGQGRVVEIPPQTVSLPGEGTASPETKIAVHVDPVGTLWPNLPFGSIVEVRRRR